MQNRLGTQVIRGCEYSCCQGGLFADANNFGCQGYSQMRITWVSGLFADANKSLFADANKLLFADANKLVFADANKSLFASANNPDTQVIRIRE
jgi:hypothetical protein